MDQSVLYRTDYECTVQYFASDFVLCNSFFGCRWNWSFAVWIEASLLSDRITSLLFVVFFVCVLSDRNPGFSLSVPLHLFAAIVLFTLPKDLA